MNSSALIQAWTDAHGRSRAEEVFAAAFGARAGSRTAAADAAAHGGTAGGPVVVASAPGRVNLIGEHTDYNGGLCLPIALPHRTFVTARARADDRVRLVSEKEDRLWEASLSQVGPGSVSGWGTYVAGVAWALAQEGVPVPGFDLAVASCVPYGAGLSSSAALGCATVMALARLVGSDWTGPDLRTDAGRAWAARVCVRAENEIAGAPTGGMDQAAALRATAGHALLLDTRSGQVQQVPFDLAAADLELLVIDTRAEHALVDGQYAQRRASCESAAATLGVQTLREVSAAELPGALAALPDETTRARVRHVVTEIARVKEFVGLLGAGSWARAGAVMDASHASLATDYEVSAAELDTAVQAAREAGALGARMTGGGFGGSAIALIPRGGAERIAAHVAEAFSAAGHRDPAFLSAEAAAPAH
ncbi:galactokinase [Pseudactinotalea sp. Z1739]|uniref:galactokinase n=1 Tax=Pseudactinotalea sp. Z1739 TaxID=3413028 RepID=UPI003C79D779